jgi:hypothetical protein
MTLADKALSAVATGRTFVSAFLGPCLWIGISAAVIGGGVSAYASFKVTRAFYQRATLKAEKETLEWKAATAEARAESQRLAGELSVSVLENRNAEKARVDAVAESVADLGRRVRLCAQKSDVRISVTPAGAIAAVPDGQLRDLAESVREFAEACAAQRDRDATDHNALADWIERIRKRE